MNQIPFEYEVVIIHQKKIAQDVAHIRKADAVRDQNPENSRFKVTLARTGELLVRVGNDLQERYGEMPPASTAHPGKLTASRDSA